ncbi:uncharacterized protein LOC127881047 [Dreissena polymorpha]|uniref:uncharacterized protein LOC127881047 n=1 Tax=Dreissena polymorpha TaxID=45954 RepID=UPI0022643D2F|nr:uncharacterized protein LOC127881047 [Dreissena polymorpha]
MFYFLKVFIMIPTVFFVVPVVFSFSNIVRCDVIMAGQNCTIPLTTTTTTVLSAATTTTPSISSAITKATTTAATKTTTASSATTAAPTTKSTSPSGRRKRSAAQQECVPNASCELNEQTILMCRCNTGYSEDKGLCTNNGADYLRGSALSVTLVTTVMLFFI